MNIVLIAHDSKKQLMGEFCIAYKSILERHKILATAGTGDAVMEASGLAVQRYSYGLLGGAQQIAARLSLNEIDMVICFREPAQEYDPNDSIQSLLYQCDINNVPFATNIATAEVLVKGLERGDLSWRELVNPTLKS